jgi:hypothetical protein
MRSLWLSVLLSASFALAAAPELAARDWFVRAGAEGGDGSREKPFADPWLALERCEAGDRIHVAEGVYTGRFGSGTWLIPFDRVELLGGYDARFEARDPWRRPTRLHWDKKSENWPQDVRLSSLARDVVVDGLVIDMRDQNGYIDEACTELSGKVGETAMRFAKPATVRHCVVINPGFHGIDATPGSTIENNVVVNAIDWGITIVSASGDWGKTPAKVAHNTVLFTWDVDSPGRGSYRGSSIALRGPAIIEKNLLAYADNNGVYNLGNPEKLTLQGNLFFANKFCNLRSEFEGAFGVADDASMEMLEEFGLRAFDGNRVEDPRLALDGAWSGLLAKREAKPAEKPKEKEESFGWGESKPLEFPKGIAPAWSLEAALRLVTDPAAAARGVGARAVPLEVRFDAASAATSAKTYAASDLRTWHRDPAKVDGQALELVVAIGSVANISQMPASFDKQKIVGYFLFDAQGEGVRITGFFPKGTNVERVCDKFSGVYQGNGKPKDLFRVRGTAYAVQNVPKAAFHIDSIEPFVAEAVVAAARPKGRDWFVKAGAMGGDGTREKPYRDPFQALERCESGDSIHVAEGEYHGKLKGGRWRIEMPYVALLGGYDASFAKRNPWVHPTRLLCPTDYKGSRGGYTLEGAEDHRGAIVDGIVFDKLTNNRYLADGSLDPRSDTTEHLWFSLPECQIRNCVFVNGALGALRLSNGQLVENCIFLNHVTQTVTVDKGHTTEPFRFRANTVAFAWDKRPGHGKGSNGHLIYLGSDVRAVVEKNVFVGADNDAVRLDAKPEEIALIDNVFHGNLWSHVQHMPQWRSIQTANWAQLLDLGLKVASGNTIQDPALALDEPWFASYRARVGPADGEKGAASGAGAAPADTKPAPAGNPFEDPPAGGGQGRVETPPTPPAPTGNPFDEPAATGGGAAAASPSGSSSPRFAPAYPWQHALTCVPRSPSVKAGAHPADQTVKFEGIVRVVETHTYAATTWEIARNANEWAKLDGQRVELLVAIKSEDNQYLLPGVAKETHLVFQVGGPEGTDSGGLPLRCYILHGTRFERAVKQAKGYGPGKPEQRHVIRGIAKANRQMIVEEVERKD